MRRVARGPGETHAFKLRRGLGQVQRLGLLRVPLKDANNAVERDVVCQARQR